MKKNAETSLLRGIDSLAGQLPGHSPSTEVVLRIKKAIYKKATPERKTEFAPVMDMNELSDFLRVSKETIVEYFDEIPSFELGGKILFLRKSVEKWIETKETNFGRAAEWANLDMAGVDRLVTQQIQ